MKSRDFLFPVLLLSLIGCGSDRPKTVRVEGRVTLAGGEWPASGMIVFSPSAPAEGFPRRPGRAIFGPSGEFTVTTFAEGDGLLPGEYRAAVFCGESVGSDMEARAKSYVPARFQSPVRSGLTLSVPIGAGPLQVLYDIPASADGSRK
ncbi:MAG: hypothetical protein MI757_13705 [Pirellulales bacterium]|nr:hypothetical protein [Pirellulales bacterium]